MNRIDKNGIEVKVGDIMLDQSLQHVEYLFHVDKEDSCYMYRRTPGSDTVEVVGRINRIEERDYAECEVIGNIETIKLNIL